MQNTYDQTIYDSLISVIVPVDGDSGNISRCINSILSQTYRNIEIIIVDKEDNIDGSSIPSGIRIIHNGGIDAAIETAHGDNIGFVDAGDHIGIDFYRLLIKAAIDQNADISIGNTYLECEDGYLDYFNLNPIRSMKNCLVGDEVSEVYEEQKELFFSWKLLGNKLYRTELLKESDNLDQMWKKARRVVHNPDVFYILHPEGSFDPKGFFYTQRTPAGIAFDMFEGML